MKILIIEDDYLNRTLIKKVLNTEKYDIREASNGKNGLLEIKKNIPDLIILDLMLPDMNGYNVCKEIKENPKQYGNPIILMLTAKTDSKNVVEGFDVGADDYLKKPFQKDEFKSRIRALLRRTRVTNETVYKYEDIVLDKNSMTVELYKDEIGVSKTEYALLEYLIINKGMILSREKLLENVWDDHYELDANIVNVYIKKIRDKIPILKDRLISVRGFGYRLEN